MMLHVCLFGQPRTWRRCLPRLLNQLEDASRKSGVLHLVSVNVKDYNTYPNMGVSDVERVSEAELQELKDSIPKDVLYEWSVTTKEHDDKFWSLEGHSWHYDRMFTSIQRSFYGLKSKAPGDNVLLSRLDVAYSELDPLFRTLDELTLYSTSPEVRFYAEAQSRAVLDAYLYGNVATMNLMVAGSLETSLGSHSRLDNLKRRWPAGPNRFLSELAYQSSIFVQPSPIRATFVRPNSPDTWSIDELNEHMRRSHVGLHPTPP